MPDWTHNTIKFEKMDDEEKFRELRVKLKIKNLFNDRKNYKGLFSRLLELKDGDDIYKEIGAKWDTSREELKRIDENEIVVVGDTPWGPPVEGLRKVSEKYSCRVVDNYTDETRESGIIVCEKGEVIENVHFESKVDEVYYYLQKGDEKAAKRYVKYLKMAFQEDDPTVMAYETYGDKQKILKLVKKFGDDKLYNEVELYLNNQKRSATMIEDNTLNESKQPEGDIMEQNKATNEKPVYQVVGDTPVLAIWFKTIGQEKFIFESKILTIPDHVEKEVLHISEILDAYVEKKYKTYIKWNEFGDAHLVLKGITFPLEQVSKLIAREESNELFEYRLEKAEKIIRACIENIDEVYQKENVVEDIKFTI